MAKHDLGGHSNFLPEEDYEFEENSAEELKYVLMEFFNRDSNWSPSSNQIRMNNVRIDGGYKVFGEEMISNDPWADVMNRYRFASRLEAASGVISDNFLRQKLNGF